MQLRSQIAEHIIKAAKSIFARHGTSFICFTDNEPYFPAYSFMIFAKSYGFQHDSSSPRYPHYNGKAEKNCLDGQEYVALINWPIYGAITICVTPSHIGYSLAQFCRQLRSTFPVIAKALKPATPNISLITRKDEAAKQYQ